MLDMVKKNQQPEVISSLIVGLGETGFSCARFLARTKQKFTVTDSRDHPPELDHFKAMFPDIEPQLGRFSPQLFCAAKQLIVSPGVAVADPAISAARDRGVPVLGDIELFARYAEAPIIAITGSNGKSTVTTLLGEMAKASGVLAYVGGNIGVPVLDLLERPTPKFYLLELSSFQLETTYTLNTAAAVVLNISADHLDRYDTMLAYRNAKARIYRGDGVVVVNDDEEQSGTRPFQGRNLLRYGCNDSAALDVSVTQKDGLPWIQMKGEPLIAVADLGIQGAHNVSNALAAVSLAQVMKLPVAGIQQALRDFTGLAHRCQWVGEWHEIRWVNDSKGTNVGATMAALAGMSGNKTVLIAGGVGKNADFSPLAPLIAERARVVILFGEDAQLMAQAWHTDVPVIFVDDMQAAVLCARDHAQSGDCVLLSPACASFDLYKNYEERGEDFMSRVKVLHQGETG